jgi:hypothetical protein
VNLGVGRKRDDRRERRGIDPRQFDPNGLQPLWRQAALDNCLHECRLANRRKVTAYRINRAAVDEFRKLVDARLRSDPEYRAGMRRRALRAMPAGAGMFLGAGALYACYCWYASVAPDPPPDSCLRALVWPIKASLTLLLAIALLSLGLGCHGLSQWWHIRRIERAAAADNPPLAETQEPTG